MKGQTELISMFNKKLNKTGQRIFELEYELIKLKAELEVEKRYNICLEHALERQIKLTFKGEK